MKSLLIVLLTVGSFVLQADAGMALQARAYAVSNGAEYNTKSFRKSIAVSSTDGVESIGDWTVEGVEKPTAEDLPTDAEALVIIKAAKQGAKSELHKLADTELVALLIESGDLVSGSTSVGKGKTKSVEKRLLRASASHGSGSNADKSSNADESSNADRNLSIRISQMKQIIISEGGDPDDAIVHP